MKIPESLANSHKMTQSQLNDYDWNEFWCFYISAATSKREYLVLCFVQFKFHNYRKLMVISSDYR